MAETLSSLRTRVRQRADMENSTFCSDSEINRYINSSYQELYDLLVDSFEDYYTLPPVSFSISSGTDYYTLPSNFYKLRGIDAALDSSSSNYYSLTPFEFLNRNNSNQNLQVLNASNYEKQYRIVGDRIYITPDTNASGNYRIHYIPRATILTVDASTLDGINGWEEYVVVDAARKCLAKEESDTTELNNEKLYLMKRIVSMATKRDAGMPKTIVDVNGSNGNRPYRIF